ncbi:hypothetical protein [Comamonas thiooxydans]|uniref:hypothetical protein n=1 Tax=Comamonas thiooxydans TaxID=363952 RepID=UPI003D05B475
MNFFSKLFGKGKGKGKDEMPGANPKSRFYLRDASREGLTQPVHIHFDSYKPVMEIGGRAKNNPCIFLVTVNSPNFNPKGMTCYVSGINHKLTPEGIVDGVLAHVKMVMYGDDNDSLERVLVQLHEDGRVVGLVKRDGKTVEITDLSGVYFMPGDSIYLDGMGNQLPPEKQPGKTKQQEALFQRELQELTDAILRR